MARGKMSLAGRKKIAAAQRKRWAEHHRAKLTLPTSSIWVPARRGPGRPPKAATVSANNPFLGLTVADLVATKRQIDAAWSATQDLVRSA